MTPFGREARGEGQEASGKTTLRLLAAFFPVAYFLLPFALLCQTGCAWTRWSKRGELSAFGPKVPCRLPPHATAEEIVQHLNQNVDKLQGWQARHVKLRANNMPLQALIAVEKGQHLRIQVSSIAGSEMDLGCNNEVFWFWTKRGPQPAVRYAAHQQMDHVRETLQIPFEPDWLMEALGVAAISLQGVTLEHAEGKPTSVLASQHVSSTGRKIRKTITVDNCHGRVLEHSVWDAEGRRIAHATFSNHRLDPESGVVLAHQIRIEWPQADMSLAMDLGQVEINPVGLPAQIWDMPHMPGYPVVNLEDIATQRGGRRPRPQISQGVERREEPSEDWRAHRELSEPESLDLDGEAEPLDVEP